MFPNNQTLDGLRIHSLTKQQTMSKLLSHFLHPAQRNSNNKKALSSLNVSSGQDAPVYYPTPPLLTHRHLSSSSLRFLLVPIPRVLVVIPVAPETPPSPFLFKYLFPWKILKFIKVQEVCTVKFLQGTALCVDNQSVLDQDTLLVSLRAPLSEIWEHTTRIG